MFCKNIIKSPKCFDHYCLTFLRVRPLYLVHYHFSACLLRHLPIRYVAVCRLCVCVPGVPVCGLSGRELLGETVRRQFTTRQPTNRYIIVIIV
jgi:hypothetical protein